MENQVGKRPFANDAIIADAGCCVMAYLWIDGNGCCHYLYQQYGAGDEYGDVVF